MFCIQTFLFKYDIITSYMEDFSAFKYTTITELFYFKIKTNKHSKINLMNSIPIKYLIITPSVPFFLSCLKSQNF